MSTAYNGLPGNEARKGVLTVTGATNAIAPNPIQITTSAAHGLSTGELVYIYGVQGNLAANGRFYVSVTGATTFTLYSGWVGGAVTGAVSGSGAYVGTGGNFCYPLTWNAASTLPDDGDALNASSVNSPLEGNFDREAWLISRAQNYALVGIYGRPTAAPPIVAPTVANGTVLPTGVPGWGAAQQIRPPSASEPIHILSGDVIDVTYSGSGAITFGAVNAPLAVRLAVNVCDYSNAIITTYAGPEVSFSDVAQSPINLHALTLTSVTPFTGGRQVSIDLEAYSAAALAQVTCYGQHYLITRIWRPVS